MDRLVLIKFDHYFDLLDKIAKKAILAKIVGHDVNWKGKFSEFHQKCWGEISYKANFRQR